MADEATQVLPPVTQTQAAPVTLPPTPAPPVTPVITPPTHTANNGVLDALVPVHADKYREMQNRLALLEQIEAKAAQEQQAAKDKEIELAAKNGEIKDTLRLLREQTQQETARIHREAETRIQAEQAQAKLAKTEAERQASEQASRLRDLDTRYQRSLVDTALSQALAPLGLMPGSAEELTFILQRQLTAVPNGESFAVRTATSQTAAELVAQYVAAHPHHIRAQNPGGGTAMGQMNQSTPTPSANPPQAPQQPRNISEAVIMDFAAKQAAGAGTPLGDTRLNTGLAMGLKLPAKAPR